MMGARHRPPTVRAELVEAPHFFACPEEGQPFDKFRADGVVRK